MRRRCWLWRRRARRHRDPRRWCHSRSRVNRHNRQILFIGRRWGWMRGRSKTPPIPGCERKPCGTNKQSGHDSPSNKPNPTTGFALARSVTGCHHYRTCYRLWRRFWLLCFWFCPRLWFCFWLLWFWFRRRLGAVVIGLTSLWVQDVCQLPADVAVATLWMA